MNQAPERVADVGLVLDILHSRRGTCRAGWFVPERWNHTAYADGTTDLGRPGELRLDLCDFFAACIEKALREAGAAAHEPAGRKPLTESVIYRVLLLHTAHIGEVQSGIWSDAMWSACFAAGIPLL
jgi:hypothetical protein